MRTAALVFALSVAAAMELRANDDPSTLESPSEPETGLPLPLSLRDAEASVDDDDKKSDRHKSERAEFSIGPMGGFLKAPGADRGTWFGGIQARFRFLRFFAVEGSISFHQNRYADGDVVVTQYPVQVSALILPFPNGPLDPYVLAGAGWYYSRIDYDDSIGGGDDTESFFGFHVGAGTNLWLTPKFSLFGDFRWVFVDEPGVDNSNLEDEEFDYWQVTFGLNFKF